MPMNIDPELLAHLQSLERIGAAEERRAELLRFAEKHLAPSEQEALAEIEDPERLFRAVYDLFTRGPDGA